MGQQDIIECLEKNKTPMTSTEISKLVKINVGSVARLIRALKKDKSIKIRCRRLTPEEKIKKYGHIANPTLIVVYWLEE